MKCLLCKGKGSFLVYREDNKFDPLMGGVDFYTDEPCPRCLGRKEERYIGPGSIRLQEVYKVYNDNYMQFFKESISEEERKKIKFFLNE